MPLPVACISYASPLVGNASFNKAFQAMEKLNRLRHVRVTNEFDVVPLSPPRTGYVQTGINVHLLDDEGDYEISYAGDMKLKSFWSQFRLLGSAGAHSLVSYWQRGESAEITYLDKLKQGKYAALYVSDLYSRFLESSSESWMCYPVCTINITSSSNQSKRTLETRSFHVCKILHLCFSRGWSQDVVAYSIISRARPFSQKII